MYDDIDDEGLFDGAWLCHGGYRERGNMVEIVQDRDLLCVIQRNGTLFKLEYLRKLADPQWSRPIWSDKMESSLTDSIECGRGLAASFFANHKIINPDHQSPILKGSPSASPACSTAPGIRLN